MTNSFYEDAFLEDELASLGVWDIRSKVLLHICVHMVVDSDDFIVGDLRQVLHTAGLAG